MSKRFFLIILGCLISSFVLAQPFFFGSTPSSSGTTTQRVSPSELDKKIADSAAQNQAALQENLNQQLAKVPPPTIVKVTPSGTSPAPTTASNPFAPTTPVQTPSQPVYSMPTTPSAPQQVYTGFGGSSNTNNNSNSNTNKPQSSQWNIKY